MKTSTGLSTKQDGADATREAVGTAIGRLDGRAVDLAMVFCSLHHGDDAWDVLQALHETARPASVVGCVAEAVVEGGREIEGEPAVSVWLASLPGPAETFH
jgi:small ligand-binding sensory domain FIST